MNILFKVVAEIVDGRKVPDLARYWGRDGDVLVGPRSDPAGPVTVWCASNIYSKYKRMPCVAMTRCSCRRR